MESERTLNPIDIKIGENIRRMRQKRGLTQQELGHALSKPIGGTAIMWYETGENRVPAANLVEISNILHCPIQELLDGIPGIMLASDSDMAEKLMESPEVQDAIRNLADAVIKSVTGKL